MLLTIAQRLLDAADLGPPNARPPEASPTGVAITRRSEAFVTLHLKLRTKLGAYGHSIESGVNGEKTYADQVDQVLLHPTFLSIQSQSFKKKQLISYHHSLRTNWKQLGPCPIRFASLPIGLAQVCGGRFQSNLKRAGQ